METKNDKYFYYVNIETGELNSCFVKDLLGLMDKYNIESITPMNMNAIIENSDKLIITGFNFKCKCL